MFLSVCLVHFTRNIFLIESNLPLLLVLDNQTATPSITLTKREIDSITLYSFLYIVLYFYYDWEKTRQKQKWSTNWIVVQFKAVKDFSSHIKTSSREFVQYFDRSLEGNQTRKLLNLQTTKPQILIVRQLMRYCDELNCMSHHNLYDRNSEISQRGNIPEMWSGLICTAPDRFNLKVILT